MELTFRPAQESDKPALVSLWQLCFPEDDELFISRFLHCFWDCGIVASCKGDVLSMLFLLPAEVTVSQTRLPVRYLYAGGTHPACRKEGIFGRLLRWAADFTATSGGYGIYLHPASAELAVYYEKQDYQPGIGGWSHRGGNSNPPCRSVNADEYLRQRDGRLPTARPCWRLLPPADRFFLEELLSDGWRAFADDTSCCLIAADDSFAYDCLSTCPDMPHFGADTAGEWQNTAWWIPTGMPEEWQALLSDEKSYTAFLGDM